ncbi:MULTISPECIES: autotransporter domain-containing protein [unclassified Bradyrhizobium]|uniref:autotransporter outer membrane beta-barrel domain-containing protein n=1 Tax=unclassified Bradyrhizobium TaxID=2631580 RepID=UPI0028EBD523|nr:MULTISPECIES: autotransporter domain-containing protein [unclassified Bradyrhizobium]
MRQVSSRVVIAIASVCCAACPASATDLWQFDFTSSRGSGQFLVNPASFVIPVSAGSPSTFNVVGANITIDAGGVLGTAHYTLASLSGTNCTPAECRVIFSVPDVVPGFGTYDVLLQLNFERIWVNWSTPSQQQIQMWLSTNPAASFNWNDVGAATRTVVSVAPGWRATPLNSDWNTAANWTVGSVPLATDTAQFGASTATAIDIRQSTEVAGLTFLSGAPAYTFNVTGNAGGAASLLISGAGVDDQSGNRPSFMVSGVSGNLGTLQFENSATAGDAVVTTGAFGVTRFTGSSSGGNAQLVTSSGGTVDISGLTSSGLSVGSIAGAGSYVLGSKTLTTGLLNTDTEVSGVISGTGGTLTKVGSGALILSGSNTYSGGTQLNAGSLVVANNNALGSGTLTMANGTSLSFANSSDFAIGNALQVTGSGHFAAPAGTTQTVQGTISDGGSAGTMVFDGVGTMVLAAANAYTGGTVINAGTLRLSGGATLGAASGSTLVAGGILDLGGTTQIQNGGVLLTGGTVRNGVIASNTDFVVQSGTADLDLSGAGGLTKTGSGTFVLAGTASYTGATTINGGVFQVDGALTGTSAVNLNSGMITGTGTIDPLTVSINNGTVFAPGNGAAGSSMAIVGNLAFQSGAIYLIQLNPTASSFASISGTASPGGATVDAIFEAGGYVAKRYTILTAGGGVSGTFASLANTNLPAGFKSALSYDANAVHLDLSLDFVPPSAPNYGGGLSANQQSVATALTRFFDTTGSIPLVFGTLSPLGLTQVSGELASAPQQATFNAMGQFISLLADHGHAGRDGVGGAGPQAYAEEGMAAGRRVDSAFASMTRHPASFEQRWNVWGDGFGGSHSTDGSAGAGSTRSTSRIYGTAVGVDYLLTPATVAGFALAGGGTGFTVDALGTGRSDLFLAGAYLQHIHGPAYLYAALAYGWQDVTTDRTIAVAGIDRLKASFNVNAYSGRLETGYRLSIPAVRDFSLTPYAAGQAVSLDMPRYTEQSVAGASVFALSYAAKRVTDYRTEIGLRTGLSLGEADGVLSWRGRIAWAHNFNLERSIAAAFQSLPGASFTINGARPAPNAALTTLGLERQWRNGWSAAATLDGEFSSTTRSYSGRASIRHIW